MKAPFKAVLLGCANGHYEATLEGYVTDNLEMHGFATGGGQTCGRCQQPLYVIKTVTITPANPQPLRAVS